MISLGAYLMTISDASFCGITDDHHSDDLRGAIYDCNIFIIQATGHFSQSVASSYLLEFNICKLNFVKLSLYFDKIYSLDIWSNDNGSN